MTNPDLPALVYAPHGNGEVLHITRTMEQTRCGRDCRQWSVETHSDHWFDRRCPHCGTEAEFVAIEERLRAIEERQEAIRQAQQARWKQHDAQMSVTRKRVFRVIEQALLDAGFNLIIEQTEANESFRALRYLYVLEEGVQGHYAYQVSLHEMTRQALKAKARNDANGISVEDLVNQAID